jgi:hypothetical protein
MNTFNTTPIAASILETNPASEQTTIPASEQTTKQASISSMSKTLPSNTSSSAASNKLSSTPVTNAIEVRNLNFFYGKFQGLKNIHLDIA